MKTTWYDVLFRWGRIPLAVKMAYTAFVAVLVPIYWHNYGPTNFLYFCDVALLLTLPALWLESPLLASMPAVGICLAQLLWQIDFLCGLFGKHPLGLATYMFDDTLPLHLRALSFFHFWLPLLLLYAVWRLGYDRRAFLGWTALSTVLILVCYFLMPAPPKTTDRSDDIVNINYVYGLHDKEQPQSWMPQPAWLAMLLVGLPLCLYLPSHLAFARLFRRAPAVEALVRKLA
jgi:hypothetical protein